MLIYVLILCAILFTSGETLSSDYSLKSAEQLFEEFIKKYHKVYTDDKEKRMRYEIFKDNLKKLIERNSDPKETADFGISKFTDMTAEEFLSTCTGLLPSAGNADIAARLSKIDENFDFEVPERFDWRELNVVTKVKNQGTCNSCWAFSTTGTVEGAYAMKHKVLEQLSEQQLVNCAERGPKSLECIEGWRMDDALKYLTEVGGLETEKDYPYTKRVDPCYFDKKKIKARVTGYSLYNVTDENKLKRILIKKGPLAIGLDASDIQFHPQNVLQKCSYVELNHGVLLVGYGEENGIPFWTLKNSWGENWGEGGYFRIRRGVNACGILNDVISCAEVA